MKGQTIADICGHDEKAIEAMRKKWGRKIGGNFDRQHVPTDGQLAILSGPASGRKSKAKTSRTLSAVKVSADSVAFPVMDRAIETPSALSIETVRTWAFNLLCLAVVFGHAGLVWYDCADRWKMPGMIGGGVVFLVVALAVIVSTDPSKNRTSLYAVWFVFFVDCAAFFVHYPVFLDSANIGSMATGVLCAFLCASSFVALYLFRDFKLS